ncbi:hypothetical protein ACSU1N_04615 [Thermogladius sp. 4427co]|uniref:hypothetical protein n=1 Tax=Thermogladius sp. 4427co TaxID=3450718 RepID=UPI003F78DB92
MPSPEDANENNFTLALFRDRKLHEVYRVEVLERDVIGAVSIGLRYLKPSWGLHEV